MENNKKSKKRIWDKIIMGAVVGGAIGSVIGASIAPKAARETQGRLKRFFNFFRKLIGRKKTEPSNKIIKKIPNETLTKTTFSQTKEKANHDQ